MVTVYMSNFRYVMTLVLVISTLVVTPSFADETAKRRPDFTLPDLDGRERSISEWDGKAMLVNFWATWCIPCLREIPLFSEIQSENKDNDFVVLGIAVDTPENVREYLDKVEMNYLTLVEEQKSQQIAREFSPSFLGLPFTAFLDHQGRVLWMQSAEIHRDEIELVLEYIRDIRTGKTDFARAQAALGPELKSLVADRTEKK